MNRTLPLVVAASLLAVGMAAADHPQTKDGHEVTFDHKTGNEWWVEVLVSPQPAQVHARDTDGDWRALTLRDWGAWAASFHIEPGHDVWFRATFADGTVIESCAFTHPEGVEQCETPPPPPPGDYVFDHKTGNEWWVEVLISPKPVAAQAMDTGGAWKTLTFRDWGAWAASFHIEPGHDVRFRAQDSSGAWHESCWFTHPAGAEKCDSPPPPPPPPPGEFDATFSDVSGNEWWVQVDVDANEPIASVHARVVGETWHALTKRSWGAWAASFHIDDGERVEFRATSNDGDVDLSDNVYVWPEATPEPRDDPSVWPRAGSYVVYELETVYSDGEFTRANATLTYKDDRWEAFCDIYGMTNGEQHASEYYTIMEPGYGPTSVATGDTVTLTTFEPCHAGTLTVEATGAQTEPARKNGDPVTVDTWHGMRTHACSCLTWEAEWHRGTGLSIWWSFNSSVLEGKGRLVDTDAPIAQGDEPLPAPARTGWPFEGSYVEYTIDDWDNETADWRPESHQTVRFEFRDGGWHVTCDGWTTATQGGDRKTIAVSGAASTPPMAPIRIGVGDNVYPVAPGCPGGAPLVEVRGQFREQTTMDGQDHVATVWWGDESAEEDADGIDEDVWWDIHTGLLLRWESRHTSGSVHMGHLTDTDAPLSTA